MPRPVKAVLEADVERYVYPVGHAGKATKDLDDKIEALDRDLSKIPADAAKAGASMKLLAADADTMKKNLSAIGDKSTALNVLDARIRNSRSEVRKLTDEFVKTGDVDVFAKLGKASGELKGLTDLRARITKELKGGLEDGAKEGTGTFASVFQGGIIAAFQSLPSEAKVGIVASLVAVAAATAPLIGATINAGILAGVGGAGLAAGIALAAQDPAVAAAYAVLGQRISARLKDSVSPFTSELIGAATVFGTAFDRNAPKLDKIFASLAIRIGPLADGLTRLIDNALPGVARAVDAAGPILQALADNLPQMGKALDSFFSSLAAGGPGAVAGFKFLLASVEALVVALGWLFEALSKVFGAFDRLARGVRGLFTGEDQGGKVIARNLKDVGDSAEHAGTGVESFARKLNLAQDALDAANKQLNTTMVTMDSLTASMVNKVFSATMGLDQATLRWNQSLTSLNETLKDNGKTLDIHKEKGQANVQAILSAVTANMQLYQAMVTAGASAGDAASAYEANTAALERQLRKAGYTKQEIDGLIGKYRDIPKNVDTQLALKGLTDAINDLNDLIRLINHMPTRKDIYVYTHTGIVGGKEGPSLYAEGGIRRAAEGLLVPPRDPGTVLFGEPQTGGEAFIPLKGVSQMRAMGLAQTVGNAYGFDVAARGGPGRGGTIQIVLRGGDAATQALMGQIRAEVSGSYGGDVQVALGRG